MPRDVSLILTDVRGPTLALASDGRSLKGGSQSAPRRLAGLTAVTIERR